MEELTITRALAELKLLDKRITKKIESSNFISWKSRKNNNFNSDAFTANSIADYQSILDLVNRRNRIKSAMILSNANTKVMLGENEITVAEVIERKQNVQYWKSLYEKLRMNRESITSMVERNNQQMETELHRILELNFGKTSSTKTNSDDIENISKAYRESNKSEIVDPINIDQKMKDLEKLVDEYEREANFVLSESNATTKIRF